MTLYGRPVFSFHVFMSHRHLDDKPAMHLTHALQNLGIRAWMDMDAGPSDRAPRLRNDPRGRPFPESPSDVSKLLEEAIEFSIIMAVVTSPNTLESLWVREEIAIARRAERPLFFWHIVGPNEGQHISLRRNGAPSDKDLHGAAFVEAIADNYSRDQLASNASSEFMGEIAEQEALNLVGHKITPINDANSVAAELNTLVEMSELVLHKGEKVCAESLERIWREYQELVDEATGLKDTIYSRYGRVISVGRDPAFYLFRLKRPFVRSRVKHLQRILNDEVFRAGEFKKLDRAH